MKRLRLVPILAVAVLSIHSNCGPNDLGPGCYYYGEAGNMARQLCLMLPAGGQTKGLIVYFHGGGWLNVGGPFPPVPPAGVTAQLQEGWALANVTYSLSAPPPAPSENPFPVAVQDAKRAVRWLKANGPSLGVDPDVIVAWGHSAGGNLAAMVGAPSYEPTGLPPALAAETSWVDAIITFAGVLDLAHVLEIPDLGETGDPCTAALLVRQYLDLETIDVPDCQTAGPEAYRAEPSSPDWNVGVQASPYAVWSAYTQTLSGPLPMLFMAQGDADPLLSVDQTDILYLLFDVFQSPRVDLFPVQGATHAFGELFDALGPAPNAIDAFLLDAWNTYSVP